MPVYQLYPPANPEALADDHHYTASHPEEIFLKSNMLHEMSAISQVEIEAETRGQAKTSRWKEVRSERLTASKFGQIINTTDAAKCAGGYFILRTLKVLP